MFPVVTLEPSKNRSVMHPLPLSVLGLRRTVVIRPRRVGWSTKEVLRKVRRVSRARVLGLIPRTALLLKLVMSMQLEASRQHLAPLPFTGKGVRQTKGPPDTVLSSQSRTRHLKTVRCAAMGGM